MFFLSPSIVIKSLNPRSIQHKHKLCYGLNNFALNLTLRTALPPPQPPARQARPDHPERSRTIHRQYQPGLPQSL
jgi:hypothetical protein